MNSTAPIAAGSAQNLSCFDYLNQELDVLITDIDKSTDLFSQVFHAFDPETTNIKDMLTVTEKMLNTLDHVQNKVINMRDKYSCFKGSLMTIARFKETVEKKKEEEKEEATPIPDSTEDCLREIEIVKTKLTDVGVSASFVDTMNQLICQITEICQKGDKEKLIFLLNQSMELNMYLRIFRKSEQDQDAEENAKKNQEDSAAQPGVALPQETEVAA